MSKYQRLFSYLNTQHDKILLDSELQEIIQIVLEEYIGELDATNKPALWGYPIATTAVDGRTIHVGDLCEAGIGEKFTVVFEGNSVRNKYDHLKLELCPALMTNKWNEQVGLSPITIIKKYNEQ